VCLPDGLNEQDRTAGKAIQAARNVIPGYSHPEENSTSLTTVPHTGAAEPGSAG
jgi:hypothetical protein